MSPNKIRMGRGIFIVIGWQTEPTLNDQIFKKKNIQTYPLKYYDHLFLPAKCHVLTSQGHDGLMNWNGVGKISVV